LLSLISTETNAALHKPYLTFNGPKSFLEISDG
jgi:hypothetical protein